MGADHDHPHEAPVHDHHHDHGGPGHNHARPAGRTAQWQTPHLPAGSSGPARVGEEPDLDLVEKAFVEGFSEASDPVSFLRLAQVPFESAAEDGHRLVLLRVETELRTDVGSVMPHLGGTSFRYDPLTARMASRRRSLRFCYFDGHGLRRLTLAEVRSLRQAPAAS